MIAGGNYTQGRDTYEYTIKKGDKVIAMGDLVFDTKAYSIFGDVFSLFLAMLIIMTLGLIAAASGPLQVVFVLLGLALSFVLGLIRMDAVGGGGFGVLIYFIIAGGIIIWKLASK